jgi:hypothetical protein
LVNARKQLSLLGLISRRQELPLELALFKMERQENYDFVQLRNLLACVVTNNVSFLVHLITGLGTFVPEKVDIEGKGLEGGDRLRSAKNSFDLSI